MTAAARPAIRARNLSKVYRVYPKPSGLLREIFTQRVHHQLHVALDKIDLEVAPGECVGVIGPNGAGKSTLLKIIAGTLAATTGSVEVSGKVSAILELGTGFHPEYSGRDNVILGAMCLGMPAHEVRRKFDWIVDFAELADVIDQPFKTYSSGMQARLAFATAISIAPEILIIDEALAAGDSYFVVKCGQRMREICESGATVLFVSHSTHQVATLCDRALWIEAGRIREIGPALDVCRHYDYAIHERLSAGAGRTAITMADTVDHLATTSSAAGNRIRPARNGADPESSRARGFAGRETSGTVSSPAAPIIGLEVLHNEIYCRGPASITKVEFLTIGEAPASVLRTWDPFTMRVWYQCEEPERTNGTLGLAIGINRLSDNLQIAQFSTGNVCRDEELVGYSDAPFRVHAGLEGYLEAYFEHLQLIEGDYVLSLGILPNVPNAIDFYEYHHMRYRLPVIRAGCPSAAVFYPHVRWDHVVLSEERAQSRYHAAETFP